MPGNADIVRMLDLVSGTLEEVLECAALEDGRAAPSPLGL